MDKAYFFRKAANLKELAEYTYSNEFIKGDETKFSIFKAIEMSEEEYKEFTQNLLYDRDFIKETTKESDIVEEKGEIVLKCILVKEKGKKGGVLVHSSGYDYPRYTAIYK